MRFATTATLALIVTLGAAPAALGQAFPAEGNETVPSLGEFQIQVAPAFQAMIAASTPPGFTYNSSASILTSPLLSDANTIIAQSAPIPGGVDSPAAINGVGVGFPPFIVKVASLFIPPKFAVGGFYGTGAFFTEMLSLDLTGSSGAAVTAGGAAPGGVAPSLGETQSNSAGLPTTNDFPAMSFFDIFVDVNVPLGGGPTVDLRNPAPLVMEASGLTSFPSQNFYSIDLNVGGAPLYFSGGPYAGDLFGTIGAAGVGLGFDIDSPSDVTQFDKDYAAVVPEPGVWAMTLVGVLALGGALRLRRAAPA